MQRARIDVLLRAGSETPSFSAKKAERMGNTRFPALSNLENVRGTVAIELFADMSGLSA